MKTLRKMTNHGENEDVRPIPAGIKIGSAVGAATAIIAAYIGIIPGLLLAVSLGAYAGNRIIRDATD